VAGAVGLDASVAYAPGRWDFWRLLYERRDVLKQRGLVREDPLKELSKLAVEEAPKLGLKPGGGGVLEKEGVADFSAVLIDVGGIQSLIMRSSKLASVVGASVLIDIVVMAQIPLYLQTSLAGGYWLPLEAFLCAAGGINLLIVPNALLDELRINLRNLREKLRELGLMLKLASAPLVSDWRAVSKELGDSMALEKFSVERTESEIKDTRMVGVWELCELCYLDVRSSKLMDVFACDLCRDLHELGQRLHFARRYEVGRITVEGAQFTPQEALGRGWPELAERVIEVIAGHDGDEIDELNKGRGRIRNVALAKVDGNLMGPFFAEAISPCDYFERSARTDISLKKAYERAIEALYAGVQGVDVAGPRRRCLW